MNTPTLWAFFMPTGRRVEKEFTRGPRIGHISNQLSHACDIRRWPTFGYSEDFSLAAIIFSPKTITPSAAPVISSGVAIAEINAGDSSGFRVI